MILTSHRHCAFLNIEDSDMHLKCGDIQTFRAFMEWEVDTSNIKSVSTLLNKYSKLQMLYKWTVARSIDSTINDSIQAVIQTYKLFTFVI